MAVVIPLRFASTEPALRDRIVGLLRDAGLDVRRSTVEGFGEIYLMRAGLPIEPVRESVTDLLEHNVPGWQDDVESYWPR